MEDSKRFEAELPILRDFVDFLNQQAGVYMDCLAGFDGNIVRISRQIPRVNRPTGRIIRDGEPTIVWTTLEDAGAPDVIINNIRRSQDYLSSNSEAGLNEQQICWSIVVFIFAYWDEEIRPAIANIRGVKSNEVIVDVLGDLRILRKSIIHNKGIVSVAEYAKLKIMTDLVEPNKKIVFTHDQMHQLFVRLKQSIGQIISRYVDSLAGAPNMNNIQDIAIQFANPSIRKSDN